MAVDETKEPADRAVAREVPQKNPDAASIDRDVNRGQKDTSDDETPPTRPEGS